MSGNRGLLPVCFTYLDASWRRFFCRVMGIMPCDVEVTLQGILVKEEPTGSMMYGEVERTGHRRRAGHKIGDEWTRVGTRASSRRAPDRDGRALGARSCRARWRDHGAGSRVDKAPVEPVCVADPASEQAEDDCGIFVSSSMGDDANPGTSELPVQTFQRAISLAQSGPLRVYACAEVFREAVRIPRAPRT